MTEHKYQLRGSEWIVIGDAPVETVWVASLLGRVEPIVVAGELTALARWLDREILR